MVRIDAVHITSCDGVVQFTSLVLYTFSWNGIMVWKANYCFYVMIFCSPTVEDLSPSKSEKLIDASEIIRDGKVHFKIRIGENKVIEAEL